EPPDPFPHSIVQLCPSLNPDRNHPCLRLGISQDCIAALASGVARHSGADTIDLSDFTIATDREGASKGRGTGQESCGAEGEECKGVREMAYGGGGGCQ